MRYNKKNCKPENKIVKTQYYIPNKIKKGMHLQIHYL